MNGCCIHPFESAMIQSTGDVYCCCCFWTDFYSFGNIFEKSFDEIWNGEKAQEFRKQFIEKNYKYCKVSQCDPAIDEIEKTLIAPYPKRIEFSYDRVCNVRCIFCRNHETKADWVYYKKQRKLLLDNFEKIFTPVLKKAEIVELNSAGELFASKYSVEMVEKIIKINPKINFSIISNGILFTKETTEQLQLTERLSSVIISVHATTEKTYNKLVERGNFKAVMKNIKYLSELKKENNNFNHFRLNFVVTSINWKEMKPFIKLAKSLGAIVFFINYHRQIDSDELLNRLDITQPTHPQYNDFVKYLQDDIFDDECCTLTDYFRNLKPVKKGNTFIDKVKSVFIK